MSVPNRSYRTRLVRVLDVDPGPAEYPVDPFCVLVEDDQDHICVTRDNRALRDGEACWPSANLAATRRAPVGAT